METTTEPQTDGPGDERPDEEQRPNEAEERSAGSIVADLIQEMSAGGRPVAEESDAAEPAAEVEPGVAAERAAIEVTAEEPAVEVEVADEPDSVAGKFAEETSSTEESASQNSAGEESAEQDSAEQDSAEQDSGEEESAAEESAAEDTAGRADEEPDVLIELDVDPGALEAILLVVDEPLTAVTLASVLDRPEPAVAEALRGLAMAYDAEQRGFDLREVAGGWRLYTREEYAGVVEKFVLDGQQAKLTQASLETLAVVAYRQPVSRSRVSAIRGVNCDGVMRTLISRGLVEEAGVEGDSGATLYRTTSYFLERLGLNSLDELPDLAPYLPEMDEIEDAIHPDPITASSAGENEPPEPDEQ